MSVVAAVVLAAFAATASGAYAQTFGTSNGARQRYEKATKGANIDDYVKRLGSDDPEKRLEAVKSLGASKDKKAVEFLLQATGDTDVRVRAKAVQMLGDMRATEATPVLVQYLSQRGTEPQMKQLIIASLGKIGDPTAARPIMEFLRRDLDRESRGTAIFALGEIAAPESVSELQQIEASDQDDRIRQLAADALVKVQHSQAAKSKEAKGPADTFLKPDENQARSERQ
jgi:HEAT repeat protein